MSVDSANPDFMKSGEAGRADEDPLKESFYGGGAQGCIDCPFHPFFPFCLAE
jgi:hypothetical protein